MNTRLPRAPLVACLAAAAWLAWTRAWAEPVAAGDFSAFAAKHPWTVPRVLIEKGVPGSVPETVLDEALVPRYALPELLRSSSGAAVTTPAEWRARRAELIGLFETEVFGRGPGRPAQIAFEPEGPPSAAFGGRAEVRRIAIRVRLRDETFTLRVVLAVPAGRAEPAPVFLFLNYRRTSDAAVPETLPGVFWPVEYAIGRGFAMAALDLASEVEPDQPRATTGLRAFYRRNHPHPGELTWGALGAWAWGASRVVDYLVTAPGIDAKRIAVIGHSRGGKAALWAGAQDERIALVVPNNAGAGGPALARRRYGNTIEVMTGRNPHWFAANYATYARRESALPVDQHMLVALVAPRGYHAGEGAEDLWHDPRGSWLALAEASRAWALLGAAQPWRDPMPLVNDPTQRGPLAWHIRSGGHGLPPFDWKLYLDHADAWFASR